MLARLTLTSTLCASLLAGAVPSSASRLPGHFELGPAALEPSSKAAPTSVLGLESRPEDEAKAKALTNALRKAFERHGFKPGESLGLGELRLMMGCDGNDPSCLSRAGESMGVEKLVYGKLNPVEGGSYELELTVLDVTQAVEEAQITQPLSAADLSKAKINAKADDIVLGLFPPEEDVLEEVPPVVAEAPPEKKPVVQPPPPEPVSTKKYEWGPHKGRPKWKWAGLGTGIGLTVAGAVGAAVTGYQLQGPLRDELVDTARASLTDTSNGAPNPGNDIDPSGSEDDLCEQARAEPEQEPGSGKVTNASVTRVCNEADAMQIGNWVSFGVMAAGLATTAVFTTLLFVRKNPSTQARLRRVRVGGGPTAGGFAVQGSFRF